MDPYYEQRLRDEVIYLHSLWHQGPPGNPNPNPNFNPARHLQPSNPIQFKKNFNTARHLQPSNPTTQFKKPKTRPKKGKKRPPQSDPPPVSDLEWPCNKISETPSSWASGWPTLNLPATRPPSAEEQARFASTRAHQKALKAAQEFFASNVDSDGDEDINDSDEDDMMDEDGCEDYQFFSNTFTEDGELRGYYETNREGGDFCCLVCGGMGKRVGKRFKDCVALVQHSRTIAKTKKRAHRAYAQVICKVLGWDIDRLPAIISSMAKPVEVQGNAEVVVGDSSMLNKDLGLENVNNGELVLKEISDGGQEVVLDNSSVTVISNIISDNVMPCTQAPEEVSHVVQEEELHNSSVLGMPNVNSDNVMVCESSLNIGEASKCVQNLENGVSSTPNRNAEGVVNCLCRNVARMTVLEMK